MCRKCLNLKRVYLVGEDSLPWSAALLCPCGCGSTIRVSLVAGDHPRWRAKRHFSGSVTLHPSIWRNSGCRSHFFLLRGRIVWSAAEAPRFTQAKTSEIRGRFRQFQTIMSIRSDRWAPVGHFASESLSSKPVWITLNGAWNESMCASGLILLSLMRDVNGREH